MKFSTLTILFLFIVSKLFSQSSDDNFKSALMPKKDGAEVVYSSNKQSLTLDIISDNVKPLDKPNYVIVDKKILQVVFIPNKASQTNENTEEEQKQLLLGYMQYELDYIKNEAKLDYTALSHDWVLINNKLYLLWYYNMPDDKKETSSSVLKQINLSTLSFAHVLNLNTPVVNGDNFDDDKGLLLKVAQTLKQNNFKLDFNGLYHQLNPK